MKQNLNNFDKWNKIAILILAFKVNLENFIRSSLFVMYNCAKTKF